MEWSRSGVYQKIKNKKGGRERRVVKSKPQPTNSPGRSRAFSLQNPLFIFFPPFPFFSPPRLISSQRHWIQSNPLGFTSSFSLLEATGFVSWLVFLGGDRSMRMEGGGGGGHGHHGGIGGGEAQIKGTLTHGGRYVQYNVYGNLLEVSSKYVPPIRPVGRGACGIIWSVSDFHFSSSPSNSDSSSSGLLIALSTSCDREFVMNWSMIIMFWICWFCGWLIIIIHHHLVSCFICSAAVNAQTRQEVAIKKIGNAFDNQIDAKRTLREIKLLRHMDHDNVSSCCNLCLLFLLQALVVSSCGWLIGWHTPFFSGMNFVLPLYVFFATLCWLTMVKLCSFIAKGKPSWGDVHKISGDFFSRARPNSFISSQQRIAIDIFSFRWSF